MALSPKRVKHRKVQRGRIKGEATRCNSIDFGEYALVSLEPFWLTNRQIEAARVAINRRIKRGGKVRINLIPKSMLKLEWVRERVLQSTG